MSGSYNYNAITLELLYRNYMEYIRNSSRILNNTVSILYNQQQTYNNIINNYNNNYRNSYLMNMPQYYRYRPITPENNNYSTTIPLPSVNDIQSSISFYTYSEIDISTNTTCPITQRDFNSNDIVVMLNTCNHIYDPHAIMQWFSRCSQCPLCRRSIIRNQNSNQYNNSNDNDNDNEDIQDNDNEDIQDNNQNQRSNNRETSYEINQNIRNYNELTNMSFADQLANLITQEINRDLDFSGNIQIEFGIPGR